MYKNEKQNMITLCSWCAQPTQIIWVHGHGQCSLCGTNIDECCRGENCNVAAVFNPVIKSDQEIAKKKDSQKQNMS